jgi:hypothetical protein
LGPIRSATWSTIQPRVNGHGVFSDDLASVFKVLRGAIRAKILDQARPDMGISGEDQQRLVDAHGDLLAIHVLHPPGLDTVRGGVVHRIHT